MAEVAAVAEAEGTTLQGRLDALAARFGRHVTAERSVRVEPAAARRLMSQLRSQPPMTIAGVPVGGVQDIAAADLLRFDCGAGVRVQVRPSGTEPKVKIYVEVVDTDPTPFLDAMETLLTSCQSVLIAVHASWNAVFCISTFTTGRIGGRRRRPGRGR